MLRLCHPRTKRRKYFPGICEAAGCKADSTPTPGLFFHKNSIFLCSLLKSAANADLKLISEVIAIAHGLCVNIKLLSVRVKYVK